MCNAYRLQIDIASIAEDFDDLRITIKMPEGAPGIPARRDVRINDMAPIVKASDGAAIGTLVNRRWSWPGQGGKPIHKVRAKGRDLGSQRCLVLCDGFYGLAGSRRKPQEYIDKFLYTMKGHRWFCMAGIWRDAHVGEAFSLLTLDARPDSGPDHHRLVIPLARDRWAVWLDPRVPAEDILQTCPEGSLDVTPVFGKPPAQGAFML